MCKRCLLKHAVSTSQINWYQFENKWIVYFCVSRELVPISHNFIQFFFFRVYIDTEIKLHTLLIDRVLAFLFRIQCVSVQKLRQFLFVFLYSVKITLFDLLWIISKTHRWRKKTLLRDYLSRRTTFEMASQNSYCNFLKPLIDSSIQRQRAKE